MALRSSEAHIASGVVIVFFSLVLCGDISSILTLLSGIVSINKLFKIGIKNSEESCSF